MSKESVATAHWEAQRRLIRIQGLMVTARDYSYPAGQAQVGIQMATVEVPWLLNYIEELRGGNAHKDVGAVAV